MIPRKKIPKNRKLSLILAGFELVKQNRFAKIYRRSVEKGLAQSKNVFGFANHFMKNAKSFDKFCELIWLSFAN